MPKCAPHTKKRDEMA